MKYFEAYVENGWFEGPTLHALMTKIVTYYGDYWGKRKKCPVEAMQVVEYNEDEVTHFTHEQVDTFNRSLEQMWEDEEGNADYTKEVFHG